MDLKKVFVVGTGGFLLVSLALFYILTNSTKITGRSQAEVNLDNMEKKLEQLEAQFASHKMSMKQLEELALSDGDDNELGGGERHEESPKESKGHGHGPKSTGTCSSSFGMEKQASSKINMLDVYELLKFDNQDGGVWKQGFDIKIDESRFTKARKLQIFVIPHSHNDPGWLKTFEKYYQDQTRHILDNMLNSLSSDKSLKFIWAEISYFNLWWSEQSEENKKKVEQLVKNKQLEFVTGGWVMPDEANSHYYSILTQLTEGHQWLQHHLNVTPSNGWAIDPFGMSPTMAYVLRRSGFSNMLIQRTHYSVKKHLSELRELEFKWRQSWDSSDSTDINCHMMPFYSYDVPHTCGPDPKICCQFDFKRLRGISSMNCPWNVPPQPIVTKNVRERSLTLLDQYKKKAMLFKSNVLLIPLGDDFRWEDEPEWNAQTLNYGKIFEYINSQSDLHTRIKFGTLQDYFEALGKEISAGHFSPNALSGDFFTYADRDDHYWSGYFTSRPFHKAMDRELIGHLRAAQMLYTLMAAELSKRPELANQNPQFLRVLLGKLRAARRILSLFQHHDGVTGTSKDHVMVDYAQKLYSGLVASNDVMKKSLFVLSHLKDPGFDFHQLEESASSPFFEPVLLKDHHHSLPHHTRIILDGEITDQLVSVFNPSSHARIQHVSVYVSTHHIKVLDIEGESVDFEIFPVFEEKTSISINSFQLFFIAKIDAMAVKHFIVKYDGDSDPPSPEILVINSPSPIFDTDNFKIKEVDENEAISISNEHLKLYFKNGFAESVVVNGKQFPFSVGMYKYGANNRRETSGLYLFIPDGEAVSLDVYKPLIRVVKGKLMSYVEVWIKQVKHRISLYNYKGPASHSIDVSNIVDIREEENYELVMRLKSSIQSGDISYTDLNGFQMIRRKKFDKLPIQANYYPLPAATYIQDGNLRMTLVSGQPLGTASLASGELEVIMDRRLMQDDNRGVGQGGKDNLETRNYFKILFEIPTCEDKEVLTKAPMLSLLSQTSLHDLLHPMRAFSTVSAAAINPSTLSAITDYSHSNGKQQPLACDIELVDMTMLPSYSAPLDDRSYEATKEASITVRRLGFDGRFSSTPLSAKCSMEKSKLGNFALSELFGDLFGKEMNQMTLSFTHKGSPLSTHESVLMKPMEIYAFKAPFKKSR